MKPIIIIDLICRIEMHDDNVYDHDENIIFCALKRLVCTIVEEGFSVVERWSRQNGLSPQRTVSHQREFW